jgi:signal transduction histidine kinase
MQKNTLVPSRPQDPGSLCIHHESTQEACLLVSSVRLITLLRQAETRQQAIEILLDQSLEAFSADGAGVYDLREEVLVCSAGKGFSAHLPDRLPADATSLLGRALKSNRVIACETASPAPADQDFCAFFARQGMLCLLLIPLRSTKTNMGVLVISLRRLTILTASDHQLLNSFSEAAGNTLHRLQVTEQLRETVANRDRELRLLYDLMAIGAETSEQNQLLQASLQRILQAMSCAVGVIHLVNAADQKLKIVVSQEFPQALANYLEVTMLSRQLWQQVYQSQALLQVHNIPDHRYSPEIPAFRASHYTYLGAPIHIKGRVVGVLSLFGSADWKIDTSVEQLAGSAADVLGPSIESVRLHKQVEDAVILQERQRMARNLHDSVSQSLYGLVISADVSEKLLRIKDFSGLRQELRDIGKVALQGLKDMRLMLNDIRPASLETVGLEGALEIRLNTVECRAGIQASLAIAEDLKLSQQMEQEVYQIAIEALNNSLKHSEATEVSVALQRENNNLLLEVRDNGAGFDPNVKRSEGGMGLTSMHERARILGGELFVRSMPGEGTAVILKAPLTRIRA